MNFIFQISNITRKFPFLFFFTILLKSVACMTCDCTRSKDIEIELKMNKKNWSNSLNGA